MAPFDKETGGPNHNECFMFKGYTTAQRTLSVIKITLGMLQDFKARVRKDQEIQEHYAHDEVSAIVLINGTEGEHDFTRMVMLPLKWVADIVDKNSTPHAFLQYNKNNTSGWAAGDGKYQE